VNWNLVSVLAFFGLVICVFYLVLTGSFFGNGPISIAIQVASVLLMAWARLKFGVRSFHASAKPTQGGLVTSGPYRYIRHPIYAAILYFLWAGIAAHFSLRSLLIGVIASGMLALRLRAEEILLERVYPEYAAYARGTARVLPFLV
jgi:protein-S-isoprenylcysteine O-methyltransferase Ste14